MGAPRSTTRDLERYAGLFARRTQTMKSSAMRDLMAVTAAAGGDLAGRRAAGHEHVPGRGLRGADGARGRRLLAPRRSSTGRPRASTRLKECIVQVMAAEGMEIEPAEILVTTGGQQVIDLVCKTLLDPGDVVIAEAPTYPGAVPVFGSYQADVVQIELDDDGMRVDLMEEALDRLDAEGRVPKFIYTVPVVPEPGRGDAVAGAAEAAGRGGAAARAARARGQPVRAAALRGRPAADAVLARRRRVRHLPRDVLEDPLARAAAGLDRGAAAGAGEDEPRQGQRRPLLVVAVAALRGRLLRRARLAALRAAR